MLQIVTIERVEHSRQNSVGLIFRLTLKTCALQYEDSPQFAMFEGQSKLAKRVEPVDPCPPFSSFADL